MDDRSSTLILSEKKLKVLLKASFHRPLKDVHSRPIHFIHLAVTIGQPGTASLENDHGEWEKESHLDGSLDEVEESVDYPETCLFLCYADHNYSADQESHIGYEEEVL